MMAKEYIIIKMEISMKEIIKMIKKKEEEFIIINKVINMKENIKMIKWMEEVFIIIMTKILTV